MTSSEWIDHIHAIRAEELERVLQHYGYCFHEKDLLEVGSGTGFQLKILSSICRSSVGLEIRDSGYREHRIAEVREYDGRSIPFPDASFDIIFSSHVLQSLTCEQELYREMRRVLRPEGMAVHIVPTSIWRFWSSVLHYPAGAQLVLRKFLSGASHGTGSGLRTTAKSAWFLRVLVNMLLLHRLGAKGNWFTEHFIFHPWSWRRRLAGYGWIVDRIDPLKLWCTGRRMIGGRLSMRGRDRVARILGSSSMVILARPAQNPAATNGS
jgi:SAM-dependent methyltransferase